MANGSMASYFTSICFPKLALRVRNRLATETSWGTRSGLGRYLQCAPHSRSSLLLCAPEVRELEQWLASIHPSFATYAAALGDCGYEDLSFLREVEKEEFEEALIAAGMSKPVHRARVLRQLQHLSE